MRLIDADALLKVFGFTEDCTKCKHRYNDMLCESVIWRDVCDAIFEAPTIDAVPVETVCEMFGNEAPCNYGLFGVSVDDFMMSKCGKWCEDNCDKVPYTECWRKFFEAIEKWRKQNG